MTMTPEELLEHAHGYAHELIRTADPEGEHLAGYLAENAEGTLDLADNEAICELMATCDVVIVAPGPTIWDLPAEPGRSVRAVRDRRGRLWTRDASGWSCEPYSAVAWRSLVEYDRPLIDATFELSAPPSGATAVAP